MNNKFKYINSIKFENDLMYIEWNHPKYGFGTFAIYKINKNGNFYCDDEYMGREMVKEVLNDFIDNIEFNSDPQISDFDSKLNPPKQVSPFLYDEYGNKIPVEFGGDKNGK